MKQALPRILLGATLLAAIAAAIAGREHFDAAALQAWVAGAGAAGPLLFMALYALATVLFLPGSVITLAGGALFGPFWGTLWNLTGATLGAALAFLIARYLGADWVARRAGPRLTRLNEGVAAEGWRFVAFVRLVPLFPFNLLNYALGLTRIPFGAYVLASWLFMLPGAFAYTWLGYAGAEALAGGEGMIRNGLIALALLAATAFLPRWLSRWRAARSTAPAPYSPDSETAPMTAPSRPDTRPCSRPALAGLLLGVSTLAIAIGGGIGARQGWWHFLPALQWAEWAAWGAVLALALSVTGLVQARPGAGRRGFVPAVLGTLAALPLVFMAAQWEYATRAYPPINDISTDTQDAPVFWDMPIATDYPGGQVAEQQRAAYPDLAPLKLALAPAQAYAHALAVVKDRGWEVVSTVPEEGRIEATARSRLYGFVDEVAIRVSAEGAGSKIDVRSRSRTGRIDRGVNAKRIRAYLAAVAEHAGQARP